MYYKLCCNLWSKKLKSKTFRTIYLSLTGLLTFSRTFIVIWILLNIISLKISLKNVRIFGIGFLIVGALFFIDEMVGLNNPRFDQLKSIVNNEIVSTEEINEDSRTETWARFYDQILDSPLIGNGYGTFSGKGNAVDGVHNSYLRVIRRGWYFTFSDPYNLYIVSEVMECFLL